MLIINGTEICYMVGTFQLENSEKAIIPATHFELRGLL